MSDFEKDHWKVPERLNRPKFDELDAANEEYFTPEELAKRWGYSTGTLSNQRHNATGPGYVKIRGRVMYPKSKIYEYERQGWVQPGREKRNRNNGADVRKTKRLLKETGVIE